MDIADFQEVITCGICLDTFDEGLKCPRILSCGHSFCESCLEKLLMKKSRCPTCITKIQFTKCQSIPINFSLKSLVNIRCPLSREQTVSRTLEGQAKVNSEKFFSEGHCDTHDTFKGMRCMDCEVWICSMCVILQHKHCRALIAKDAYLELKRQVSQKVEKELGERNCANEGLAESLKGLEIMKKSLIEDIKSKNLELIVIENNIKELESQKSNEEKFCIKLKQLQEKAENSVITDEFSKTIDEIEILLEEVKKQIAFYISMPITREALDDLCQNRSVYVVDDRYDGTKYGKVAFKDGRIWIYSFQNEKPVATIFNFWEFLSRFNETAKLPKTTFLLLYPEKGGVADTEIVIETDGVSPRAMNFILLCSALKGHSYKGLVIKRYWPNFFRSQHGPLAVVDGIKRDDAKITLKKGDVHGTSQMDSWFAIRLKDHFRCSSAQKIGVVISGFQGLLKLEEDYFHYSVTGCGLVI